jgi:hypothetical protein
LSEYIHWGIFKNELKASTIKSYISSLSFLHKLDGFDNSACCSFRTCTALKGAENLEFYNSMTKGTRKVMTLPLLRVLGHQITISDKSRYDKQIIWSACVLAFFGSFRFSEILPPSENSFNSFETLLWEDIILAEDYVIIKIKIPKSRNFSGEVVDLFEIENSSVCPVKAIRNLKNKLGSNLDLKKPVFTFENGKFLSLPILNGLLSSLLSPVIGDDAQGISGHSFRAALPSSLANSPDIANEEDIRTWGRWNSSAYKRYTRLKPRQKRVIFNKIVASLKNL